MTNTDHINELKAELQNCTDRAERQQIEMELAEAIRAAAGGE